VNFLNLRDAGDPVQLALRYVEEGADELVFLDVSATQENRPTTIEVTRRVADVLSIPFTVGGGVFSVDGAAAILDAGADKVSVNSAAVARPELIADLARRFGSQCVVVAIDSRRIEGVHTVHVSAGSRPTARTAVGWAQEAVDRGCGEILLTSMDADGTRSGFDVELVGEVSRAVTVPVIASGGAGTPSHFAEVLSEGLADAALAATVFHFQETSLPVLKAYLTSQGIEMRQ
jgi:cyclase